MSVRAVLDVVEPTESDEPAAVHDDDHYLPPPAVRWEYFTGAPTHTVWLWKVRHR
jgi:hypothetical protein